LTDGERRALRARYEEVGQRVAAPSATRRDQEATFDRELWRSLGESGLFALAVPSRLGGADTARSGLAGVLAALEGFADGSGDLGLATSVLAHLVCIEIVVRYGAPEQHTRWLPALISGEWVAAVANAEPRAGTDIMGLRSSARRSGDSLVVRGRKRSITNVGVADFALVSARLDGVDARHAIHAIGIELPRAGAFARPIKDLVGFRTSPTGNLLMRSTVVPTSAVVGSTVGGVELFRQTFSLERLLCGALYLAAIRRCARRAVAFAEEREQFGSPIGKNQYVQDRIVRMCVAEALLRPTVEQAVRDHERGADVFGTLSVIKLHGLEAATESAQGLMRILGSRGVRRAEPTERMVRDLMALAIFGGTVELHKVVLYGETVREHRRAVEWRAVGVKVHHVPTLDASLEAALIELVARALPGEAALRGRYYYDSAPEHVVVATHEGRPVGLRMLVERTVLVGSRQVRIAGTGIAVEPDHQRRGVGKALTACALQHLASRGVELVVAFLLSDASERLLRSFGFCPLQATVTHDARDGSGRVVEHARCFVLEVTPGALISEIEAGGTLHLGVGTW